MLDSFNISGIPVAEGSFAVAETGSSDLSWSGIGQYEDLVNPLALTRLVAAIANEGVAVNPRLIMGIKGEYGLPIGYRYRARTTKRLMSVSTAAKLAEMMRYNVTSIYRAYYNFSSYNGFSGKSGTAENGDSNLPHAWFTGFLEDRNYPVAFTVIVENAGWGLEQAAPIVDVVLQSMIK